jgi:hypothetical protein
MLRDTDMMRLIVAFRNFANAPENLKFVLQLLLLWVQYIVLKHSV